MKVIHDEIIKDAVSKRGRVYLCGSFSQNEGFDHYITNGYEMGLSLYNEYTWDKPHLHRSNTEYNYLLSGRAKVLLIKSRNEIEVKTGDLYIIEKNEPYSVKCQAGTTILFSKEPGGNDKELIDEDDALIKWGSSWNVNY